MALDQQARALIDLLAASGIPPVHKLSPTEAREAMLARRALVPDERPDVADVRDLQIPGPGGRIAMRLYTPAGEAPFPVLVYFHGGGWVIGNLDSHDGLCRGLANAAGCVIASVDYRLAPEHKFPAAAEDAYAATAWVAKNLVSLGGAGRRLAVGGDSAGGNLAAVTALMARDRGGPAIAFQLLIYPVTNYAFDTPSYRQNAEGYLLTREAMIWCWQHYLSGDGDGTNPYVSPLQAADLRGLPPALVITAEYDPLRDEGEAYAQRLREAGVPTTCTRYPGTIHAFFAYGAILDQGKRAIQEAADALRSALS